AVRVHEESIIKLIEEHHVSHAEPAGIGNRDIRRIFRESARNRVRKSEQGVVPNCYNLRNARAKVRKRRLLWASAPESFRAVDSRSEEHTSELQSLRHLVCRLL